MSANHINTALKNMTYNNMSVKKWYHDGVLVFSAGAIVTYNVDSNTKYTEEVMSGESCLSPTLFTPEKSGWTFVGWREDTTASSDVLASKVMENSSITLYAVFKQTITLSYNGNGSTSGSTAAQSGTRYYNNGNVVNPTFTLAPNGFSKSDSISTYAFSKWAQGSTSGTQYAAGASVTLSVNTTFYALWTATSIVAFAASASGNVYDGYTQDITTARNSTYLSAVGSAIHRSGYDRSDSASMTAYTLTTAGKAFKYITVEMYVAMIGSYGDAHAVLAGSEVAGAGYSYSSSTVYTTITKKLATASYPSATASIDYSNSDWTGNSPSYLSAVITKITLSNE